MFLRADAPRAAFTCSGRRSPWRLGCVGLYKLTLWPLGLGLRPVAPRLLLLVPPRELDRRMVSIIYTVHMWLLPRLLDRHFVMRCNFNRSVYIPPYRYIR